MQRVQPTRQVRPLRDTFVEIDQHSVSRSGDTLSFVSNDPIERGCELAESVMDEVRVQRKANDDSHCSHLTIRKPFRVESQGGPFLSASEKLHKMED